MRQKKKLLQWKRCRTALMITMLPSKLSQLQCASERRSRRGLVAISRPLLQPARLLAALRAPNLPARPNLRVFLPPHLDESSLGRRRVLRAQMPLTSPLL